MCKGIAAFNWNKKAAPVSWADAYERFANDVEDFEAADVVERKDLARVQVAYDKVGQALDAADRFYTQGYNDAMADHNLVARKRGEWIEVSYWKYKNGHSIRYTAKRCSVCGADVGKKTQYNGCPYCFADMRGEKHEP
jgi:hypothetical protein